MVKNSNELVSTIDGAIDSPGINNINSEFNKAAENCPNSIDIIDKVIQLYKLKHGK